MGETRCVVCDELYDSELARCPRCFESDDPAEVAGESEPATDALRDRTDTLIAGISCATIVLVAAALRFWQLGRKSLWLDELYAVSVTSHGPWQAIRADMLDTNPPLAYILQSLMAQLFGRSDGAVRLLPAAAGVLATAVIYFAGKRMFGWKTGLWAAALFAVAPLGVQYAQEARMYGLLMLVCSLEILAFAAFVEKPDLRRTALLALALASVAYTHVYGYMAAALLLVPVVAIPRLRKRVGRKFALAASGAVVLFLPWAVAVPTQIAKVQTAAAGGDWWLGAPAEVFSAFVGNLAQLGPSLGLLPAGLFLGLIALGAHVGTRPARGDVAEEPETEAGLRTGESIAVLIAVGLAPVFLGFVLSKYVTPIATVRNSLVALPAVCLLAARGGMRLPRRWSALALGALVVFSLAALPAYYADGSKGQWHDAAAFVLESDSQPVVVAEDYENALEMSTYADIMGKRDGLSLYWMSNSVSSDTGTITVLAYDSETVMPAREYLAAQTRVLVISRDSESKVDDLLTTMPGWERESTREFKTAPVVRIWKRSANATPTP